jgi:hypothetical protein
LIIDWGVTESPEAKKGITVGRLSRATTRPPSAEGEDGDPALKAKIDKLDPSARALLYQQLKQQASRHNAQKKAGTQGTAPVKERARLAALPNYGKDLKSVPETSPKKAKRRDFILAFLKAHGVA